MSIAPSLLVVPSRPVAQLRPVVPSPPADRSLPAAGSLPAGGSLPLDRSPFVARSRPVAASVSPSPSPPVVRAPSRPVIRVLTLPVRVVTSVLGSVLGSLLLAAVVAAQSWCLSTWARRTAPSCAAPSPRRCGDRGQTTAEYALVLIGAAALALLLIAWATKTDRVGKLFDFVMEHITGSVR